MHRVAGGDFDAVIVGRQRPSACSIHRHKTRDEAIDDWNGYAASLYPSDRWLDHRRAPSNIGLNSFFVARCRLTVRDLRTGGWVLIQAVRWTSSARLFRLQPRIKRLTARPGSLAAFHERHRSIASLSTVACGPPPRRRCGVRPRSPMRLRKAPWRAPTKPPTARTTTPRGFGGRVGARLREVKGPDGNKISIASPR